MTRFTNIRSRASVAPLTCGLLALLLPTLDAVAQDDLARRRREFDSQTTPVAKAKKLPNLGDAQFEAARRAMRDAKFDEALRLLLDYRDLVTSTRQALLAVVPNPEKKSAGFKQMEIHVRKSLDKMTDIVADAPVEQRGLFEAIRADLDAIGKLLIRDLFPRQPGRTPSGKQP